MSSIGERPVTGTSSSTAVPSNITQIAGTAVNPTVAALGQLPVGNTPTTPLNVTGAVAPQNTTLDWKYAAASGGIVDTADVVLVAAAGANLFNTLQSMQITNNDATVGTEVVIKDGSTIIWRMFFAPYTAAVAQPQPTNIAFSPPLKSSANTALNAACITTSSQTYINAQGTVVG